MSNYDNEGYIGYFQRGFTSNDINIENGLYINNNFTVAEDMLIYGTTYLQPPTDISVNIVNLNVISSLETSPEIPAGGPPTPPGINLVSGS